MTHLLCRVLGREVLREDVLHVERDVLHEQLALVGEGQQLEAVEAHGEPPEAHGEPPEPLGDAQYDLPEVLLGQLFRSARVELLEAPGWQFNRIKKRPKICSISHPGVKLKKIPVYLYRLLPA